MTIAIAILLGLILAMLVIISLKIGDLIAMEHEMKYEIQELRLTSRTRIATAGVQSGAAKPEQKLRKLGRASVGRRIVVGGDDDSSLKQHLTTYESEAKDG